MLYDYRRKDSAEYLGPSARPELVWGLLVAPKREGKK